MVSIAAALQVNGHFRCDLPIARCYKQFLEGTTAFATSGRTSTCNGIVARDYLQWFTCNASFHSIEILITFT